MKPYIEYLAEETKEPINIEHFPYAMVRVNEAKAAADKFADAKIVEFEKWKNENFVTSENGKLDYVLRFDSKLILGKNRFKLSELIAIFNIKIIE